MKLFNLIIYTEEVYCKKCKGEGTIVKHTLNKSEIIFCPKCHGSGWEKKIVFGKHEKDA